MTTGGKLYNQGHGKKLRVEDTRCIFRDSKTFCKYLDTVLNEIDKLVLYHSSTSKVTVTAKEDILKLVGALNKSEKVITKTYEGDDTHATFERELTANLTIISSLKQTYHTLIPVFTWKGKPVYGISLVYKAEKAPSTFHLFSEACGTSVLEFKFTQTSFNKFVKELKESLDAIHDIGWNHNDINPENMVFCSQSNRFKIINWEFASVVPSKPYELARCGDKYFNHPLKFYLAGMPAFVAKKLMSYSLLVGKQGWSRKLKAQGIVQSLSASSFEYIVTRYGNHAKLSNKELHARFDAFYDNYAFAICILLLADKHKVKASKEVVDELLKPFMPSTE